VAALAPATGSPASAPRAGRDVPPPAGRRLAAAGLVVAAMLAAWTIWQPEASERKERQALELADQGRYGEAIARTHDAEDANPLAPGPLLARAAIETQAGREAAAGATLERAVLRFPGDPQTWLRLASFQLGTLERPEAALETLRGVLYLDPYSRPGRQLFLEARESLRQRG
jgi:tetratricopeptide (TPR) repeat protein